MYKSHKKDELVVMIERVMAGMWALMAISIVFNIIIAIM